MEKGLGSGPMNETKGSGGQSNIVSSKHPEEEERKKRRKRIFGQKH